jgi:23S rRNA (uracil1939-C5)-methyltransferase
MINIEIESLSNTGEGVGYINNKKVFVPITIPGDIVTIQIESENNKFIKAKAEKFIKTSEQRAKPICKYFYECGGCTLQHLNEEEYYKFKGDIIKHSISYAGFDVPENIEIKKTGYGFRRRCTFKIDPKNSKISFYKKDSKTLLNIDSCPILDKDLEGLIGPLNELLKTLKKIKLQEIFLTKADNGIECIFITEDKVELENTEKIINFAKENGLISVGYKKHNQYFPIPICEFSKPQLSLGDSIIDLPQGSFLQASKDGQNFIIEEILQNITEKDKVLDLYSGIGTYTFSIANKAKFIKSVEGDEHMVSSIKKNANKNGLGNKIDAEQHDLFNNPILAKELNKFDTVIINPPRNGASPQCEELAKSNVKRIIMVSCSPFTFSADAKILKTGWYKLKSIIGIDQFYRSTHIELVAVFDK